ncbi:MAG: arylesterase [Gammaproteobacteria bacterium]|nr:arylesterase [Gammaproteobacteria bacterium]
MRKLFTSFILFLTLVLIHPVFAAEKTSTILVMGDSLSAGYGLKPEEGWVNLLRLRLQQQNLNYRVINASITGDTTQGGLARLPKALQREKPDIFILELGANDGLRGFDISLTRNNLNHMVELAHAGNAKVLLLGIQLPANYGRSFREKFRQIFADVANQQQIAFVPFFLKGVAETRDLMQADGIHPAAEAQPVILDNIWPVLQSLLTSTDNEA